MNNLKKSTQWTLLILLNAVILFFFRFNFPNLTDIIFVVYAAIAFTVAENHLDLMISLSIVLAHAVYTETTFSPLIVPLGILLSVRRSSLINKVQTALIYFPIFSISVLITYRLQNEYLRMSILTALVLICQIFLDKKLSIITERMLYSITLIIVSSVLEIAGNLRTTVPAIAIYPALFLIYLRFLQIHSTMDQQKIEHQKLSNFRSKLATIINLTMSVNQKSTIEQSLFELASAISHITGYRYVLINILNRETGFIMRIAHYGLNQKEFDRLKSNPPTVEYISKFMQQRFKVSNSYFIPEGALDLPAEYVAVLIDSNEFEKPDAWRPQDMLIIPIYNPHGEIVGYISVDAPEHGRRPSVEDIQVMELIANQAYRLLERSEVYQNIVVRRSYDPHTLLLSHSAFLGLLETEAKNGENFAVAILDIDDLTKINIQHGHETGDRIIEKIADVLRMRVRKSDFVARYGGEEFAILLRNVSKSKSLEIIDRILDEIRHIEDAIKVTVSAGIGIFPEHGNNYLEVINHALKALEVAKKSGKDRFMVL